MNGHFTVFVMATFKFLNQVPGDVISAETHFTAPVTSRLALPPSSLCVSFFSSLSLSVSFFPFGSVCSFVSLCHRGLQNNSITLFGMAVYQSGKHSPETCFFFLLSGGLKIETSILPPLWGVEHFLLSAAFSGLVWVCVLAQWQPQPTVQRFV